MLRHHIVCKAESLKRLTFWFYSLLNHIAVWTFWRKRRILLNNEVVCGRVWTWSIKSSHQGPKNTDTETTGNFDNLTFERWYSNRLRAVTGIPRFVVKQASVLGLVKLCVHDVAVVIWQKAFFFKGVFENDSEERGELHDNVAGLPVWKGTDVNSRFAIRRNSMSINEFESHLLLGEHSPGTTFASVTKLLSWTQKFFTKSINLENDLLIM